MTTSSQVNNTTILKIASISMALAVILGAMGAHWLKTILPSENLMSFDTGVKYQIYHSVALITLVLIEQVGFKFSKWTYYLFILGIILFSGSIYLLSTLPAHGIELLKICGPITPIGGFCFIIGWILVTFTINKT